MTSGGQGAQNVVRSGAQVQLPARLQVRVQLPAQLSNFTGPATVANRTRFAAIARIETVNVAARPFAERAAGLLCVRGVNAFRMPDSSVERLDQLVN